MKRILLFAAVAGAALASCVKNESESGMTASDSKISFEAPVVGTTTRAQAGEIGDKYPTEESFKVWGWYHEGDYTTFEDDANGWKNYMTDADGNPIVVAYDNVNSWVPATDYFWPKTGILKDMFAPGTPPAPVEDLRGRKVWFFVINYLELLENGLDSILAIVVPLIALIAEIIGLFIIIFSLFKSTYHYLRVSLFHDDYDFHLEMSSGLTTALEFLLAAEVTKTILQPELATVLLLGLTFALRAAMSILLHAEMKTARAEKAEERREAKREEIREGKKAEAAQNKKAQAD